MSCGATMKSRALSGHVHVCTGTHDGHMHKCSEPTCRRWFGEASE